MSVAYKKNGTEIPITSAIMGGGVGYTVDTSIHEGVALYRFGKMRILSFTGASFSITRDQYNTLFTLSNDKPKVSVSACCGTGIANKNSSITIYGSTGGVSINGWTLATTGTYALYCTLVYFVE